jgi:hypothetical protein
MAKNCKVGEVCIPKNILAKHGKDLDNDGARHHTALRDNIARQSMTRIAPQAPHSIDARPSQRCGRIGSVTTPSPCITPPPPAAWAMSRTSSPRQASCVLPLACCLLLVASCLSPLASCLCSPLAAITVFYHSSTCRMGDVKKFA